MKVINKMEKYYDKNLILLFENEVEYCHCIPEEAQKLIKSLIEKNDFTGKKGECLTTNFLYNETLISMDILGFGKKEKFTPNIFREVLFNYLSGKKGTMLISGNSPELNNVNLICEIVGNVNYSFDEFKEEKSKKLEVEFFSTENIDITEALILNEATDVTRNLVDLPANIINPNTLAERTVELGKKFGFEVEVLDENKIQELGMNLLYSVGKASDTQPKLIVMRYFGDSDSKDIVGLVGKGLTYDTGGLCLKPADSMFTMKDDMTGGATVIGAMCAIAKNKIKRNVIAVVAACENAINGNAYRPGDIIKSMNGKYVEIINTDAEGRLALADAITYIIRNEKVSEVIDLATLTGAMVVALGSFITGVFSNCDERYLALEKSCATYGERIWRLPIDEDFSDLLKSNVADIKHTGGRWGGAITAAKFLEIFAEDTPWIHMDIAGTAYDNTSKWLKKGASGVHVKGLYEYCKNKGEKC